jgi:mannobiose 2-epimerase
MSTIDDFKKQMQDVLENNILSFWTSRMTDDVNGGYYGRIDGNDVLHADADKGAILNARILWSFAAAYRVLRKKEYLDAAQRAKRYIIDHFYDKEFGGVYWSVDYKGKPKDTKKQIYAIGFTIYGMSELARATGDKEALDMAITLFHDIENHAFDSEYNGYTEALTREWKPIDDMRLSDKDENMSKTMNTHLHIIEPYTNLYRVWKDDKLECQIRNLLDVFTDFILNEDTYHLDLFFDDRWRGKRNIQSFGHDIEASWLLHETALVLGDEEVITKMSPIIRNIAKAADEGLNENGALKYEKWLDNGHIDDDYHWWVQCENIIGHINLYEHFADEKALNTAVSCWDFVRSNLVDYDKGEWHWSIHNDGTLNLTDDKAGFWKCPYHNSRMCLEILERKL